MVLRWSSFGVLRWFYGGSTVVLYGGSTMVLRWFYDVGYFQSVNNSNQYFWPERSILLTSNFIYEQHKGILNRKCSLDCETMDVLSMDINHLKYPIEALRWNLFVLRWFYDGSTVVLRWSILWFYGGSTVVLLWSSTVVLRWFYGGSTIRNISEFKMFIF